MKLKRSSGILLHPTSLPSRYGIGDLGEGAYQFVDFLKKSSQRIWQVLPLTPTSFGDSPYQSFSTFAGNTLLISPEELKKEGFLPEHIDCPEFSVDKVDYGDVIIYKEGLFRTAFENFANHATPAQKKELSAFVDKNIHWLKDYTLFIATKQYFINQRKNEGFSDEFKEFEQASGAFLEENAVKDYYFGGAWISWPKDIRMKNKTAEKKYGQLLEKEIEYHTFLQYIFSKQWAAVKAYANESEIEIIGDIPIFIAYDSADCWANKKLFHLGKDGFPVEVAGVPPDYFAETGQLWGNPLYLWKACEKEDYAWWIARIAKTLENCDYVRIDHFRGFDTYWAVPFGDKTAENGQWRDGPGAKFFDAVMAALPQAPIIAEDLGEMFPSVYVLRDRFDLPGMKILQFAFADGCKNAFLPHNFETQNCIVYSGTHDNDTTVGWFAEEDENSKDFLRRYLRVDGSDIAWDFIRLAYSSVAGFAIVPLQDCLALGTEARMNLPGCATGNWQWRFRANMLDDKIAEGLDYLVRLYNRMPETDESING